MTLNDYQEAAMTTCMPSSNNFAYMMLNLVGEVGEFASKVAKGIRKGKIQIGLDDEGAGCDVNDISLTDYKDAEELEKEAGDILWQLAGLCSIMEWDLEDVAQMNLKKLLARKEAGTIDGNVDGISGKERTK